MSIKFNDDKCAIRSFLNMHNAYQQFVQSSCPRVKVLVPVEKINIALYHNIDDTFSTFILPYELSFIKVSNIEDVKRIAKTIQDFAKEDYEKNIRTK